LLVFDAVFVASGAQIGSVGDTTGVAKVGGYYLDDLAGSSTEFTENACFHHLATDVEIIRVRQPTRRIISVGSHQANFKNTLNQPPRTAASSSRNESGPGSFSGAGDQIETTKGS